MRLAGIAVTPIRFPPPLGSYLDRAHPNQGQAARGSAESAHSPRLQPTARDLGRLRPAVLEGLDVAKIAAHQVDQVFNRSFLLIQWDRLHADGIGHTA